jgi:hypothetical protein
MLIKKSEVEKLARALCDDRANRGGRRFTRIGQSFYEAIDAATRNAISSRVNSAPSKGVTLQ